MLSTALFLIIAFMVCMKLAPKNEWQSGFVIALLLGLASYYVNRIVASNGEGVNMLENLFSFTFAVSFIYCCKIVVQEAIGLLRTTNKA